ncbi:LTA synthase family protein [Dysgonomonas sp. 520]|uniref:LTA synthase family protein n=1 Tax=Dysgonomonas sp. 520 TaxID=2302931 RepID=UPI0013D4A7DF|nr:alkaline phosphatase family protein [Dysgonomonas sp. 520]NDW08854.1 alkaline phosphatase family protein [Dysgonomonas sp. 520]
MNRQILNTRIALFIKTYLIFVLLFVIQKVVFLVFHWQQSSLTGAGDWFSVMWKGLPMDFSTGGYLVLIPLIILVISLFTVKHLKQILNVYFMIVSALVSIIFLSDVVLYSYWGFRIDSTVFAYITSPAEVVASISIIETIGILLIMILLSFGQYFILRKLIVDRFPDEPSKSKVVQSVVFVIIMALMIIPIRGGISTATMSPGSVYFSNNMFLNHAAINPVFNIFYSLKLSTDFSKQYRFMDDKEAHDVFADLMHYEPSDTIPQLLNTDRPNIVFIVLESFGAKILEPLGGEKGVAPNLNKLTEEGVFFRKMYANSFRTDRGLVSVVGGYPAQPTMSILKYFNKMQTLSSIPGSLVENGYNGSFLYGGDLDFAQMQSFIIAQKVTDITKDKDFPVSERLTKWGVPDALTFERLANDIQKEDEEPYLKMFLTLSSHEPFDVPTKRFEDDYLNSVYYTDSCLGIFMDNLKKSPKWDNTLVILIPDHDMRYPKTLDHSSPDRHDVFMLWLGGAVKQPMIVDKACSQVDLAATLLSQMKLDYKDFTFSKDIMNPTSKSFAFYAFPNGFGMMSDTAKVVFDCEKGQSIMKEGSGADLLEKQGKAYLQCLYDDIAKRK